MPTLFKKLKHLVNCKIQQGLGHAKTNLRSIPEPLGHGSVDDDSVYSSYFDLAYILLIIYSVFLYMRKHKWKRGHIYSKYVTGSSLHWCELQYFA